MQRVIFLMSGPGHLPNLVVVLNSLRRYYSGLIDVFAWPESREIALDICSDKNIHAEMIPWEPLERGKSGTYCDKTRLIQSCFVKDEVVFLDADLLICGSIQPLFDAVKMCGFVMPQFCNWTTAGNHISSRVRDLYNVPEIERALIDKCLSMEWPSVNSGIFGAYPNSPVLDLWKQWTFAAKNTFIPDEKVAHIMMVKYAPMGMFHVMTGGAWNCSPRFIPKELPEDKVVIWHFHGDSNLRPQKSQKGFDLWKPEFQCVMEKNLGRIRDWIDSIPNKHLMLARKTQLL